MIFEFGPYKADVDVEKTRRYYESTHTIAEGCDCAGCRNFEQAAYLLADEVKTFFSNLGVDPRKLCEVYVERDNPDGTLLYGGFFHVCGTALSDVTAWVAHDRGLFHKNQDLEFSLTESFRISFYDDVCLNLDEDFPWPALQIEFSAKIPWILEEENPYSQ